MGLILEDIRWCQAPSRVRQVEVAGMQKSLSTDKVRGGTRDDSAQSPARYRS